MDRLQEILRTMDVPKSRVKDIPWLMRNLGFQNSEHPDYAEVRRLIIKKFTAWIAEISVSH